MKKSKLKVKLRAFIALSCAVSMFAVSIPAVHADEVQKLEQESSELQSELSTLQGQLSSLSEKINTLTTKINTTNEKIKKTELDLVAAKLNEDMQYNAMKKRIKFMYETGNPSFIEMICASGSMVEFLNKAEFVKNITEYDKNLLEELKEAKEDIQKKEESLKNEQEELLELQDELANDRTELNRAISSTKGKLKDSSEALKKAKEAQAAANTALNQTQNNNTTSKTDKTDTTDRADKTDKTDSNKSDSNKSDSNKKPSSSSNASSSSSQSTSTTDLVLFAAILQCEAGTSSYDSLLAVATVIMNRVNSSRFPNTLSGVIYQSGQFSPTWNGSLKRTLAKGPCSLAYQVAGDAMAGKKLDRVSNCLFFNATWATNRNGVTVGGNIFW